MKRTLTLLALLGLLTVGAADALAGSQPQARKRARDGSGERCQNPAGTCEQSAMSELRAGQGTRTRQQKRDGTGEECQSPSGSCEARATGAQRAGQGTGTRQHKRDGTCTR